MSDPNRRRLSSVMSIAAAFAGALKTYQAHQTPAIIDKSTKVTITPAGLDTSGLKGKLAQIKATEAAIAKAMSDAGLDPDSPEGRFAGDVIRQRQEVSSYPGTDLKNDVIVAVAGAKVLKEEITAMEAAWDAEDEAAAKLAAKANPTPAPGPA